MKKIKINKKVYAHAPLLHHIKSKALYSTVSEAFP